MTLDKAIKRFQKLEPKHRREMFEVLYALMPVDSIVDVLYRWHGERGLDLILQDYEVLRDKQDK